MSVPTTEDSSLRLNKYLALHLGISRREADSLIEQGAVKIDGTPVAIGQRVHPESSVEVKGKPVATLTEYRYILLNKPENYVCSRRQQGDSPTIYALLPKTLHNLKPVGRLDRNSSGLILLTNDGDFAHRMTHPSFHKQKIYRVRLNRELEPLHQQMISDYGITLEDGASKLLLERLSDDNRKEWLVTMSEGRNRQIRRTFASLGYDVTRLHRTHFGPYSLDNIKRGEYRTVTPL